MLLSTETEESIPVIDFSAFLLDEGIVSGQEQATDGQKRIAEKIDQVCRGHGFLGITNFGMESCLLKEAFQASEDLFAMPDKEERLARIRPETNMGYAPFRSEGINRSRPPELKEAYNSRFPPAHRNNFQGTPEGFEDTVSKLLPFYKDLIRRYAFACALALELPHDFFVGSLRRLDLCTVRVVHYPPCEWDGDKIDGDVSKALRIGEHTDFGAYTFLLVHPKHGPDGLQIKAVQGGEVQKGEEEYGWKNVVFPRSTSMDDPVMIVNTGALMARWTNDVWRATAHRVVVRDAEAASRHRYSIACFVDPDADFLVDVHERFYGGAVAKKYGPITSLDFLLQKLKSMMSKE